VVATKTDENNAPPTEAALDEDIIIYTAEPLPSISDKQTNDANDCQRRTFYVPCCLDLTIRRLIIWHSIRKTSHAGK